jgi:hypothetical protein
MSDLLQARIDELEAENNRLLETVDRMQQLWAENSAAVYWKKEFDRVSLDATRYRFIRSLSAEQFDSVFGNCPRDAQTEALDRYIDAAMNRERGE